MEARNLLKWQKRLLPVMVAMVIGLTIFFFVASFVQLFYLHGRISQVPDLDLKPALSLSETALLPENQKMDAARWNTLSRLEQHTLQRRYHQANVLLMARVWTGYLGFVTGMTCTLIGAVFILGKLQEPPSQFSADAAAWKFSLTTASPGLMLALLGTILMVTTLVSPARIEVEDKPTFVDIWRAAGHSLQLPDELLKNIPAISSPQPSVSLPDQLLKDIPPSSSSSPKPSAPPNR